MNDTTQKIAAEAAELLRIRKLLRDNISNSEFAEVITEFQTAIEKATEETNAANCSLLALAAIVKGHPDTPESLKAIASKELLDHTRGAYLINELRTLRAAHASEYGAEQLAIRTARAIRSIAERAGLEITDDVELAWRDAILYALPQPAHASEPIVKRWEETHLAESKQAWSQQPAHASETKDRAAEAENVAMRMQEDGYIKQRDVRDVTVRIQSAIEKAYRAGYLKGNSDCSKAYMALNETRAAHASEPE